MKYTSPWLMCSLVHKFKGKEEGEGLSSLFENGGKFLPFAFTQFNFNNDILR